MEEWRYIPGYEGHYLASSHGRIASIIQCNPSPTLPYYRCSLTKEKGVHKEFLTHHLIAKTFIGERPEGMEIDHIDRNKLNNRPENLRYVSPGKNLWNRGTFKKSVSGISGISKSSNGNSWRVRVNRDGKTFNLGQGYKTIEEAKKVLDKFYEENPEYHPDK